MKKKHQERGDFSSWSSTHLWSVWTDVNLPL